MTANQPLAYPKSHQVNQVDDYHGVKVADPYRWLENPDSPDTKAWIEAQNKVTFGYLDGISTRLSIRERLTKLWNYEKYGIPFKEGDDPKRLLPSATFISKTMGCRTKAFFTP